MNERIRTAKLVTDDVSELCRLLAAEERQYRRLLRLAWRQNRYMKRHDTTRLVENTQQWQKYLPAADAARRAREDFMSRLVDDSGITPFSRSPVELLADAGLSAELEVRTRVRGLMDTAARLARQNAMNRELATFCLELTREEAEIFKSCVLDDPAGCYDNAAQPTRSGPGGVLERQA
jgi:hypothetical protein